MSNNFWKRLNRFVSYITLGVLFGLIIFASNIEIKDLDIWLHLASGRHIIATQTVPTTDVLSCTIAGKPWINHEWFFQVIVTFLYQLASTDGLIYFQIFFVVASFFILLLLGFNQKRIFLSSFFLFLILLVYRNRLTIRPEMLSLFFFSSYVYLLGTKLYKKITIPILFIFQIIWSNCHGFFILGPGLVTIGLFSEWIKRHIKLPWEWNIIGRLDEDEYFNLKLIWGFVLIACFITPSFIEGALYPLKVIFSLSGETKVFFKHIVELAPSITWDNIFSTAKYPYYKIIILISFISFCFNYRRLDVGVFLSWSIFLLMSISATRNIVFFSFVAYFSFFVNLQYIDTDWISSKLSWLSSEKIKSIIGILLSVILIFSILYHVDKWTFYGYYDFDKFERKSEYGGICLRNFAYKAADFLVENKIAGRVFNDFNSGAYLLGRAYPNIHVMIDGRTEVYGPEFFKKYRKICKGDKDLIEELDEKVHFTIAFLNSVYTPVPSKLINYFYQNPEWILVYFDYDASIFLRDIEYNKPFIEKYRIDLNKREVPDPQLLKIGLENVSPYQYMNRAGALFNLKFYEQAKKEAEVAIKIRPYRAQAYKLIGEIELKLGNYKEAYEVLRQAKLLNTHNAEIRYYIAEALYGLEEYDKASKQCEYSLRKDPDQPLAIYLMSALLARKEEYSSSLKLLKKARDLLPLYIAEILEVCDVLLDKSKFSEVKDICESVLNEIKENDKYKSFEGQEAFRQRLQVSIESLEINKEIK